MRQAYPLFRQGAHLADGRRVYEKRQVKQARLHIAHGFVNVHRVGDLALALWFFCVDAKDMSQGTMPRGTPIEVTEKGVRQIEAAALRLRGELEKEGMGQDVRHMLTSVGSQPFVAEQRQNAGNLVGVASGSHLGEVNIALAPGEERETSSERLAERWRQGVGSIPDAKELTFTAKLMSSGEPINVQLTSSNMAHLSAAAEKLKAKLREYPGVMEPNDSLREGKREWKLSITPSAEALGLTLSDLARQVRQGFYGEEAQRIQRGRDDIKVMVRYPRSDRRSLGDIENMRIRLAGGVEVPFSSVATVSYGRSAASIQRTDRRRNVNVTADVDRSVADANKILEDLESDFLPNLRAEFPLVHYSFEGEQREQREMIMALIRGMGLAMLFIYALLAIAFGSYLQPAIVMAVLLGRNLEVELVILRTNPARLGQRVAVLVNPVEDDVAG